uniref:Translation initiation factor IF-3 n=1 Tax=Oryza meridionalis TaxID=40149 RepID=A0A0E0CSH0_9ORYZ
MVVGLAFAPGVPRVVPRRLTAGGHAMACSSSSARFMARRPRLVVVARYNSSSSSSYESDEEEEEGFGGGGGGWGRRDRGPDPDYDPALDIERIEASTVRLLDEQKRMVGVVSVSEAVQIADENDLILAILSLDGDPPVLRLFQEKDYKKHKYEQQKKKRTQQKRSVGKLSNLRFYLQALLIITQRYNIDIHDYSVRLKAARKFLKAGDKVKIMVNLKGRENLYKKQAIELLRRFQNDVGEMATEESKNFQERNIYLVLVPNKIAIQKEQDELNKKDTAIEDSDQSDDQPEESEPVPAQPEESKETETEVSANV